QTGVNPIIYVVFPAYAGVIPGGDTDSIKCSCISRIRGGDPKHPKNAAGITTSFPHTLDKTYMCGKCGCSSLVVDMIADAQVEVKTLRGVLYRAR
ncbi:hypothetical protein CGSMWGv284V_00870, partial [Gardnerella vaginalis 284V]